MTTDGTVRLDRAGAVARITIDRPAARNAMTMAMYDALEAHLETVADTVRRGADQGVDTPLRVVVLRGAGGSFVAGTDIAHFTTFQNADDGVRYERRLEEVAAALEALPLPTLAVVEGAAVGGGLILAAACDLRVCTPDARFGAPIARTVGNCLSVANVARLVAHLGPARTHALLLLADFLDAGEARASGFVHEVVEADTLEERVEALCVRLASHAPLTLRATKEAVRRVTASLAARAAEDDDLIRAVYGSDDFKRGVRAFLEKTRPEWEGR